MGSVSPEHFDMAQKNGVGGVGKQNGVGQKIGGGQNNDLGLYVLLFNHTL